MPYSKNEYETANAMLKMATSGYNAFSRPSPISVQPKTSNGLQKEWMKTPYSAKGILFSPHWATPAPKLTLNGKNSRKTRRRVRNTRKSIRRRKLLN